MVFAKRFGYLMREADPNAPTDAPHALPRWHNRPRTDSIRMQRPYRRSRIYAGNTVEMGRLLLLIYILLLLYGSLYPFNDWRIPLQSPWLIMLPDGGHDPYSDMLTNLLVYMPFGFLMMRTAATRRALAGPVIAITLVGAAFSLGVEYLQAFNPARVSSLGDVALNTTGTLFGALGARLLRADARIGRYLLDWRAEFAIPGALATVGLLAIGLWTLSQLTPFVPSIDVSTLRSGLKPLWYTLSGRVPFNRSQAMVYALSVGGLALLARSVLHRRYRSTVLFGVFVSAVLILKIFIVSRQISLEAIVGTGVGLVVAAVLRHCTGGARLWSTALLILGAVVVDELRFGTGDMYTAFNWVPFRYQLVHDLIGIADLLDDIWPFVALAYLALLSRPARAAPVAVAGAAGLAALMFALEWHQQSLPGRYGDITDVITPVLAWLVPWLHPGVRHSAVGPPPGAHGRDRRLTSRRAWLALAVLLTAAAAAAWSLPSAPPRFRGGHPSLPASSRSHSRQLREHNPASLADLCVAAGAARTRPPG